MLSSAIRISNQHLSSFLASKELKIVVGSRTFQELPAVDLASCDFESDDMALIDCDCQ